MWRTSDKHVSTLNWPVASHTALDDFAARLSIESSAQHAKLIVRLMGLCENSSKAVSIPSEKSVQYFDGHLP